MKVLVVTNIYPSERHIWSGCFVKEQVEDLRALGADIDVLVIEGSASRLNYLRGLFDVRRRVDEGAFDLIHAHYGLTGAVALAQRRVPIVTTFHGGDIHVRWQGLVSWFVARRTVPIFVSAKGSAALSIRDALIIPAGVDVQLFRPTSTEKARTTLGWDGDARYVLFPGPRSNPIKCVSLFERAVAEARKREPALRTAYLENLTREQVSLVMNAVDVTLLTSRNEGSPVAVRESLACTTPVVSVPVGDMSSVLAGLPGCAVEPRDPGKLASSLLRALRIGKREELRRRAEETSRRRTAERVLAVYEDVLRHSRNSHTGSPR